MIVQFADVARFLCPPCGNRDSSCEGRMVPFMVEGMSNSNVSGTLWPHGPAVLGCGNFGGLGGNLEFLGKGMDETTSHATMDEAESLGVTLFDTAERYAAGESERIIGRWLGSRTAEITDLIQISTKVGPPWLDRDGEGAFDSDYIEPIFSGSLERLGVDSVDVLYTHAPDDFEGAPDDYEPTPIETTLEALEEIRESGRVRLIGASNINAKQLSAAVDAAERMGVSGYQVIQNGFNLLNPNGYAAVRSFARDHGMAFTAYSALGSGVLTGKYKRGEPPPEGSLVAIGYLDEITEPALDAVDRLGSTAEERNKPTGALALSWLMAHPDVTAITTAPSRRPPHLSLLAQAFDVEVSQDDLSEWSSWFEDNRPVR